MEARVRSEELFELFGSILFFFILTAFLVDLLSDSDFWFPMSSSASGPVPPCARGHSASYDPDSKSVFVYGGLREGQRYSELYILNTLTWHWKLVTVGLSQVTNMLHLQILGERKGNLFALVCSLWILGERKCSKFGVSFCSVL